LIIEKGTRSAKNKKKVKISARRRGNLKLAIRYLLMNAKDNVALLLEATEANEMLELPSNPIRIQEQIPLGHKIALTDIKQGEYIIKYGEYIARAKEEIKAGCHVHVHNVEDITDEIYETERRALGL
jgi:altronate dehydratase small subunit